MASTLKAEFRKLFTVRSTYFILLAALFFVGLVSFYVEGYKNAATDPTVSLSMAGSITQVAGTIGIFGALIALLSLTHEYRYNTLVYTLTASNNRSKVLASKIFAVMSFIFVYALAFGALALALIAAGAAYAGHSLPHQDINYVVYLAKVIFYAEGNALTGLLFAALIRNQVGALSALFILPNTIEGLLSLLLKKSSVYMPFMALAEVIQPPVVGGAIAGRADRNPLNTGQLTAPKGALVFLAYLIGVWIIAWYLFLKRDAA